MAAVAAATAVIATMAVTVVAIVVAATPVAAGTDARSPRAERLPDPADRWIRAETAHLTLYSNASEEATVEIAGRIDLYRAVLARISPALTVDSPLPTSIYVFRNAASFEPYKLLRKGELSGLTANLDGYFIQHSEGNYIAVNATADNDPWPVIYHEYFHFFLYNNFTDIPLWLSEGMAECYGTFQPEGTSARIGGAITTHQQWLKDHPLLPLPRLFAVGFDSPDYQQPGRQQSFYAESWALAQYLIWGPTAAGGSGIEFLRGLPRGGSLARAIAPAIADPAALEGRLVTYLGSRRFAFNEIDLGALRQGEPARVTPIARPDTLYRLGDLLLHSDTGHLADAEAHFREAIRLQPSNAFARVGLGQTLIGRGRDAEAKTAFEQAFALAPDNPDITLKFAMALVDGAAPKGTGRVFAVDAMPPDILRARGLFERITRTAPGTAEAWAGLGSTYAYATGEVAPGIAALERAREMMPSRDDVTVNLCWLYVRSDRRDRARDLNDRVLSRSSDPEVRTAGRESVFWAEVGEATDALDGDQAEAALQRLRQLAAIAPTPALKEQVEAQLRESQSFAGKRRAIDAYNEAVTLANTGDLDGATARLETLLKGSPEPKLAAEARDLLAEVRAVGLYNGAVEKARTKDYRGALALLDRMPPEVKDHRVVAAAATLRKQVKEAMSQAPAR